MAPSFAKITGGSSASGGQSPAHIVSEAPAPTIQVVQDSLNEALKFSESALICRFNGFWPRLIALHNWISEADIFLVPQVFGARRFNVDMSKFPTLNRIDKELAELPEFQAALPARQPDAKA